MFDLCNYVSKEVRPRADFFIKKKEENKRKKERKKENTKLATQEEAHVLRNSMYGMQLDVQDLFKPEKIDGWLNITLERNPQDWREYQKLHNNQGPLRGYKDQQFGYDQDRDFIVVGTLAKETIIVDLMVVRNGTLTKISIISGETKIMRGQDIQTVGTLIIHCNHWETLILE